MTASGSGDRPRGESKTRGARRAPKTPPDALDENAQGGPTIFPGADDPADETVRRQPQSPTEVLAKAAREAKAERNPLGKARRAVRELDRDVSGEYERRSDPTALRRRRGGRAS
jgi:hypothetical protein